MMATQEVEFWVNTGSISVLLLSTIVFLFLALRIKMKNSDTSYYEYLFILAMIFASFASISGLLFRIPYIIDSIPEQNIWLYGSFFYYLFNYISLCFLFSCSIAIYKGDKTYKMALFSLLGIIFIIFGYISDAFGYGIHVNAIEGLANIEMTFLGFVLVLGVIILLIVLNVVTYFLIWKKTKNQGAFMMFIGMIIFVFAAAIGGFSDIIHGDVARYLDPVGYVLVLVGITLIAFGFYSNSESST